MIDYATLFSAIDRRDWHTFGTFLTDDVTFKYGSLPATTGHAAVLAAAEGAVAPFTKVRHSYDNDWSAPDDLVVAGTVTYTLPTGREITLPFLNRLKLSGGKVREYLIFIDPAPVFSALQEAA